MAKKRRALTTTTTTKKCTCRLRPISLAALYALQDADDEYSIARDPLRVAAACAALLLTWGFTTEAKKWTSNAHSDLIVDIERLIDRDCGIGVGDNNDDEYVGLAMRLYDRLPFIRARDAASNDDSDLADDLDMYTTLADRASARVSAPMTAPTSIYGIEQASDDELKEWPVLVSSNHVGCAVEHAYLTQRRWSGVADILRVAVPECERIGEPVAARLKLDDETRRAMTRATVAICGAQYIAVKQRIHCHCTVQSPSTRRCELADDDASGDLGRPLSLALAVT